ncbi:MAG: hypothetical protein H7Y60_15135 [Rhodospirillaceae bacterium]|nr:hypothetical protein [Rhodospirillales bacterium]
MATTISPAAPIGTASTVETTPALAGGGSHTHRRISWSAIFGGVILIVAIQLLFALLGMGFGLDTISTHEGTTPSAQSLGIGAGIWWIVSSCLALALGGFVAAWLAGVEIRLDGVLHGLVSWGAATILTLWILTSAIGGFIGGGFSVLGSLTSAAGSSIADAAKPIAQAAGVSPDLVQQQAQAYLQPPNPDPATMSPEEAQKQIASDLVTYAKGGNDAEAAKQHVIAIMAAQLQISPDEAARKFDEAQAKVQQAKAQAIETAKNAADASADAASKTSFAGFTVLLLGAIAAALGGSLAVQRRQQVIRRVSP